MEIDRPNATMGLTSFRIQAGADDGGQMRAVVDGAVLDGFRRAVPVRSRLFTLSCAMKIAGLMVDCQVSDADGNTAQATADLHFSGCLVTD